LNLINPNQVLLCIIFILHAIILLPSKAAALDSGSNNGSRLAFFTERLLNRGEDPAKLDGVVYLYCAPGSVGPTKIGVSNENGFRSWNRKWIGNQNSNFSFDLRTRRIVRNLTRAEAWTVERNTHSYLKARGKWLDPKRGAHNSPEVFDVSCAEALKVVKKQATVIRAIRSSDERERTLKYQTASPPSARPDDATDLRRKKCPREINLPGSSLAVRRLERKARIASTIYCKLVN
jgi:hypothetical protein